MSLTIPQLEDDVSTLTAALAYAAAGWYVLPVSPRDKKNPGSRVGKGWPAKSSRDREVIASWFIGTDDLLALHVGRSGAVVFDVDIAAQVPEALRPALDHPRVPFQSTRTDEPGRGHYPFLMPHGRSLGNGKGGLPGPWGEVRGKNGVIIVAPSVHEKASQGARYAWMRTGPVPTLPDRLADLLSDSQDAADAATDAEVAAFLAAHTEETRPALLKGKVNAWTAKLDAGESRHESVCGFLAGAMKEARAGYYRASTAVEEMGALFWERATTERPGDPGACKRTEQQAADEWYGILSWAVAQANAADLGAVRARVEQHVPERTPEDFDDWLAAVAPDLLAAPVAAPAAPVTAGDEQPVERYPVLDWHEVWTTARAEVEWLCEPLLAAGRVIALFSPAKTGKSLLTLEIAAAIATGRPVLGNPARPPRRVLYVDLENSLDDLRDRLTDLGYGPDDLGNLRYLSFPSLPTLDSATGGAHLLAIARQHEAALVILDTVSRVIGGEEDKADTFRALYRHAIMPLKAEGRAVMRLDHSGKQLGRGQRGSSGKADDVDAVWSLSKRNATTFDLRRTHSRTNHGDDHVTVIRQANPLRHEVPGTGDTPDLGLSMAAEVDALIRQLNELGVPREAGRPSCREALAAAGIKAKNVFLEVAIKQRKNCPQEPGAVAAADAAGSGPTPAPTPAPTAAPHAQGQSGGSGGSDYQPPTVELPPAPSPQGRGRADDGPEPDCECGWMLPPGTHTSACGLAEVAA